jgi:hypothetical protein
VAAVFVSLVYSLLRVLIGAIATSQRDQAKVQAEVLHLRNSGMTD